RYRAGIQPAPRHRLLTGLGPHSRPTGRGRRQRCRPGRRDRRGARPDLLSKPGTGTRATGGLEPDETAGSVVLVVVIEDELVVIVLRILDIVEEFEGGHLVESGVDGIFVDFEGVGRSEEHTSELQSRF